MRVALLSAAVVVGLHASHSASTAQQTIDLSRLAQCARCQLRLEPIVTFGDADGPGIIESEYPTVRFGGTPAVYAVFYRGKSRITLFDQRGRYLRQIGRAGQGPGELRSIIDVALWDSSIVAMDSENLRLVTMDQRGVVRSGVRAPAVGTLHLTSASATIISGMTGRPPEGSPFHVVSLQTGAASRHFGDDGGAAGAGGASTVFAGLSPRGDHLWRAFTRSFVFQHWSVASGRLLETVNLSSEWLKPAARPGATFPSMVSGFGVTNDGLMWITRMMIRPSLPSDPVVTLRSGEQILLESAIADNYFPRLDIIDLKRRVHVGSLEFRGGLGTPSALSIAIVPMGDGFVLMTVENPMLPRVHVYRVLAPAGP